MASLIKLIGQEQTFTTPNTFSSANSTQIAGWNAVRVVNISTTTAYVVTVNNAVVANCTILPLGEIIVKKSANTPMTASSSNLLGTLVAFENN
jgi:hypothetical protein